MLASPPVGDLGQLAKLKSYVTDWCKKHLKPLPFDEDLSFENWLSHTNYPLWRKEELRKENERISNKPFKASKYARVKCFMKKEQYPEYKYPRNIFARIDAFKIKLGPFIKAMENVIYKIPSFIKHVPVSERGNYVKDYIYQEGCVYMATDYSQYESHFVKSAIENVEQVVYDYLLQNVPNKKEFDELMNVIKSTNQCYFQNFRVNVQASRMSGEMNTSLGNGIANFFLTKFVLHELGYTEEEMKLVVEGDDGLTKVYRHKLPNSNMFKVLGFTIKLEIFERISEASFCGLIFDEDDRDIITDPIDVLLNIFWLNGVKYGKAKTKKLLSLLKCKALSALYQYPACPIIKPLAVKILELTSHVPLKIDWENTYELELTIQMIQHVRNVNGGSLRLTPNTIEMLSKPIKINTRLLMERKFNITIAQQLAAENEIQNLQLGKVLRLTSLESNFSKDATHFYENYVAENYTTNKQDQHYSNYVPIVTGL